MRSLTICFCTVLVVFSFHEAQTRIIPIPADSSSVQVATYDAVEGDTACEIYNDVSNPSLYYSEFASGMGFAVYMNPEQCGEHPYSYRITGAHFYLFGPPDWGFDWPVAIRVNIRDSNEGNSCSGPDSVLYSEGFSIPSDSGYPKMMTLSLETVCSVNQPFFLEIIYTEPPDWEHEHPSLLMDDTIPPPDVCDNWVRNSLGQYCEWYDWGEDPIFDPPGDAIIRAIGHTGCGDLGFLPNRDGWQFPNSPQMWVDWLPGDPEDELCNSCAPRTRCFPSWEIFRLAFGRDQTEFWDGSEWNRRPSAEEAWKSLKGCWGGSCAGFAISSLLFYDDLLEIDGYDSLHDVPAENQYRSIINGYQLYQFGREQNRYKNSVVRTKTPRQTLEECCQMFGSQAGDHRTLAVWSNKGSAGHEVVPYKIEAVQDSPYVNYICIYDSRHLNDEPGKIRVDTSTGDGTWSYSDFPTWGGNRKLFLREPISNYASHPVLPTVDIEPALAELPTGGLSDYVDVYIDPSCDATLTDEFGGLIGKQGDSLFSTLEDGMHITPETGSEQPPIGYFLPNRIWTGQMSNLQDSPFYYSLFTNSTVISYSRMNVDTTQHEEIKYMGNDSTLLILNPDSESRSCNLGAICAAPDSEIYCRVEDISMAEADSTRYSIKSGSRFQLDNYGSTKTYDLRVEIVGADIDTVFFHEGIALDGSSSHLIVPDWRQYNDSLMILIDSGMAGNFSDTVFVENRGENSGVKDQTGSREKPSEFTLFQNHPNPFNQTTKIQFTLAKSGFVSLNIYDILGRKVRVLVSEYVSSGYKSVLWDGKNDSGEDVASGIYFYQLRIGDYSESKKLVLLK